MDDGRERREAERADGGVVGVEERQHLVGQVTEEAAGLGRVTADQPGDPAVGLVVGGEDAHRRVEDPPAALVPGVEGHEDEVEHADPRVDRSTGPVDGRQHEIERRIGCHGARKIAG